MDTEQSTNIPAKGEVFHFLVHRRDTENAETTQKKTLCNSLRNLCDRCGEK
jgi:hypothetical protein